MVGNFKGDEVDENSNCDPLGIYAALKFSGEKLPNLMAKYLI